MCVAKGKLMPDNEKHPRSSPQTFTLQFGRPWTGLRPRVYRYLEAEYVEAADEANQFLQHLKQARAAAAQVTPSAQAAARLAAAENQYKALEAELAACVAIVRRERS
jgi:hypothetical protein